MLCTVVVDGYQAQQKPDTSKTHVEHHWRLPSTDPRDEGNYLFRLHTVDLYFWTLEDAEKFMDNVQKTVEKEQLEILDAPSTPVPHAEVMSPVVRQLESVAITDPAYHNGQTRNSRTASIPTATSTISPPPVKKEEVESYKPLAYNPAAPAAPEPIKYREKTPPPPETPGFSGPAAAAYHEQVHGYTPQPQGSLLPPPPPGQPGPPHTYANTGHSQHTSPGYDSTSPASPYGASNTGFSQGNRSSSVSSQQHPPLQSTASNPYFPRQSASVGPPISSNGSATNSQTQLMRPASVSFAPDPNSRQGKYPAESPATEILGTTYVPHPQQPLQHLQPQYPDYLASRPQSQQPMGGYSDYRYEQPNRHHHRPQEPDYDIHNQVYRPTEDEASHGHGSKPYGAGPGQQPGKIEQRAEKVEKGVNRFLRKLEKRIG